MHQRVIIPRDFALRQDRLAAFSVVINLLVVLTSGVVAWYVGNAWAYAVAFVLVGARGQASYILQHEAMHNLLFTMPRHNERVGILLSAVLGTQFFMGRKMHWDHHRNVGHADDPNEIFHNVEDRPPGIAVVRFFLFHLFGGRLWMMAVNMSRTLLRTTSQGSSADGARPTIPVAKMKIDYLALFGTQAVILIAISLASSPLVYFTLYVLPLVTLTAFFEAMRSFSEHVLPGEPSCEAEQSRTFFMDASPVERFFISQYGFHYHHVHHLYPNVVTFKVPALHNWLLSNDPDYKNRFLTRPGYVGTAVRYLLNKPFPGAGQGYPAQYAEPLRQPAE